MVTDLHINAIMDENYDIEAFENYEMFRHGGVRRINENFNKLTDSIFAKSVHFTKEGVLLVSTYFFFNNDS